MALEPATTRPARASASLMLSPEQQLIVDCVRRAVGQEGRAPTEPADWALVLELASRYGLAPIVYSGLASDSSAVPAAVLRGLARGYALAALRLEHQVVPVLGSVLEALAAAGLEPVVLKGPALAYGVYPDPVQRTFADLDLLLPAGQVEQASSTLRGRGFMVGPTGPRLANHHHLPVHFDPRGQVAIELHHHLLPPNPYHVDVDQLLARSRVEEIAGRAVRVLAPTDALLHICAHLSHGHAYTWYALRTLVDILALTLAERAALDWELFVRTVRAARLAGAVYWPLRLSRVWLGARVPDAVLAALAPPAPLRRSIATIATPPYILDGRPPADPGSAVLASLLLNLSLYSGCSLRQQLGAVLLSLFPPTEAVGHLPADTTGSRLRYAAYLVGLGRLCRGLGAGARLLARLSKGEAAPAAVRS